MKKALLSFLLLFAATAMSAQTILKGDMNGDGELTIADITMLVDMVLNYEGDYVDLGLPSGTLWATRNIGANSPEEYGYYFAWGETEAKSTYDESNYNWDKYCDDDSKTVLDLEDDAAYVNWGPGWRMPSQTQLDELRTKCTWTWITKYSVNGYEVTGPNGKSIFLPAAGYRDGSSLYSAGSRGYYWSRTLHADGHHWSYAWELNFDSEYISTSDETRYVGQSVRPVRASE